MTAEQNRRIITVADPAAQAKAAAERIIARIAANRGRVAICMSGGSSPKQLFELLATEAYRPQIPWDRVHWFIGDERFVPPDDVLNNMAAARRIFLVITSGVSSKKIRPASVEDDFDIFRSGACKSITRAPTAGIAAAGTTKVSP